MIKKRTKLRSTSDQLIETLKTSAVEIYLEFFSMTRVELFGRTECCAIIFHEGTEPGWWQVLEKGEMMPSGLHMRCFKKFRLRAATEIDRSETYLVSLFATESAQTQQELNFTEAWAYTEFTVAEVIDCKQMILDKRLKYGKSGVLAKGSVSVTLDIIYHMDCDKSISIDFGFLQGSPRRNRMYFELSKALRCEKWTPMYKSEVRAHYEASNFDLATLNVQAFHGGDVNKMVRLELFRWYKNGKTKSLGFVQTNFEKLIALKPNDQLYWWPSEDGISTAKTTILNVKSTDKSFVLSLRMASMG